MGQAMSAGKTKLHQLHIQHDSAQTPAVVEKQQEAILAHVPIGDSAGSAKAPTGRTSNTQGEATVSGEVEPAAKEHEELQSSSQLPELSSAELRRFKANLQQVMDAGGGAAGDGWSVQVSFRASGARDLLITAPNRSTFRSMKSAIESLQPRATVLQSESPRSPVQASGPRKRRKRVPYSPPDSAETKRLLSRQPSTQNGKPGLPVKDRAGVADDAQKNESSLKAGTPLQQQEGGSVQVVGSAAVGSSDANADSRTQWKQRFQKLVKGGGGALENGWTVQVSPRSNGGRDITIQSPQGLRFRSIIQAVEVLAPLEGGSKARPASQQEIPQVGFKRNAEAADSWKAKLQAVVDADGGALENGWTVKVQRRATGGRDLCITGRQGERFRSISQAADALAGNPVTVRPKQKKRPRSPPHKPSLQLASADGQPGKRRKGGPPHSVNVTAAADGSQPAHSVPSGRQEEGPAKQTHYSKILARARIQVARLRREEDIINVYEAEGWRGANREKVKPSAELERARIQILKCQAALREDVKLCEEAGGDRAIPAELYDSVGELDEAHIFCAKCLGKESYDDNDIVLCDGSCGRAYHEKCTTPPFSAAEMGDYDWLCPACETKEEILELLNEEFDFKYDLETPWDALFMDKAGSSEADGSGVGPDNNTWAGFLGSAALAESDAEDEDFRSSGSEHSANDEGNDEGTESSDVESGDMAGLDEDAAGVRSDNSSSEGESSQEEEEEDEVVEGKRRRVAVDYAKLSSELFGDASTDDGEASDDDWS